MPHNNLKLAHRRTQAGQYVPLPRRAFPRKSKGKTHGHFPLAMAAFCDWTQWHNVGRSPQRAVQRFSRCRLVRLGSMLCTRRSGGGLPWSTVVKRLVASAFIDLLQRVPRSARRVRFGGGGCVGCVQLGKNMRASVWCRYNVLSMILAELTCGHTCVSVRRIQTPLRAAGEGAARLSETSVAGKGEGR